MNAGEPRLTKSQWRVIDALYRDVAVELSSDSSIWWILEDNGTMIYQRTISPLEESQMVKMCTHRWHPRLQIYRLTLTDAGKQLAVRKFGEKERE